MHSHANLSLPQQTLATPCRPMRPQAAPCSLLQTLATPGSHIQHRASANGPLQPHSPPLPLRKSAWALNTQAIPPSLAHSPFMPTHPISLLTSCPYTFILDVGQANVLDEELPDLLASLLTYLTPLLQGMPPMGRYGVRRTAYWSITLSPTGRHFAELSRDISHTGFFTFSWRQRQISIKTSSPPPILPPCTVRLKLLNVFGRLVKALYQ